MPARPSSLLLEVCGLTVARGRVTLLHAVDWRIGRGEHWAVLGVLTNCSWSVLFENTTAHGPGWRLQEYNAGTLPETALADDR